MTCQLTFDQRRALLAEDNCHIRELVATYLERLGYEVMEAVNGEEAIEILESINDSSLDLLVTDLLMPKANGEKVAHHARSQNACERILVMSGNPMTRSQDLELKRDGAAFLEKPFTFCQFESKVHQLETRNA